MAVKTGRAWLDCDMPSMAETSLVLAKDCWDKLTESPGQVPPFETMKQLFKILCFKAEAVSALAQNSSIPGTGQYWSTDSLYYVCSTECL